jgi:hypothetical protein
VPLRKVIVVSSGAVAPIMVVIHQWIDNDF